MLLSKQELKLQKKGIENLSQEELKEWIEVCKRNENNVKFNKARRGWVKTRQRAEERLEQNT